MRCVLVLCLIFMTGCASVQIPNYIAANDNKKQHEEYTRRIYASFDKVLDAVKTVLAAEHFNVQAEVDPAVYERDARYEHPGSRNVLIFTNIQEMPRILYTKYVHLNVYIRSLSDSVEVEIRYAKATSVLIKHFKGTRNDPYVNRLLNEIEDQANNQ